MKYQDKEFFINLSKDYIKCYIMDIPSKMCRTNYDNIDKIKNNLKDMVIALEMIGR